MNAAERDQLRQAIDARRREVLQASPLHLVCSGCSCHIDSYTNGCGTCGSRRHSRLARVKRARKKAVPRTSYKGRTLVVWASCIELLREDGTSEKTFKTMAAARHYLQAKATRARVSA